MSHDEPTPMTEPEPKSEPRAMPRLDYFRPDPRLKSPAVAAVLSLMPGLGQAYLGYYQVGFLHILTVATLITLLASDVGALTPLLALLLAFFWLFNLVDAARRTMLLNQVITRTESPTLPNGFGELSIRARVFSGLGLITVGLISLAHLRFGLSLAWLQHWWPAGLVLVGAYLIYRAVMEAKE
jgi:hypothetical protein